MYHHVSEVALAVGEVTYLLFWQLTPWGMGMHFLMTHIIRRRHQKLWGDGCHYLLHHADS